MPMALALNAASCASSSATPLLSSIFDAWEPLIRVISNGTAAVPLDIIRIKGSHAFGASPLTH